MGIIKEKKNKNKNRVIKAYYKKCPQSKKIRRYSRGKKNS